MAKECWIPEKSVGYVGWGDWGLTRDPVQRGMLEVSEFHLKQSASTVIRGTLKIIMLCLRNLNI